MNHKTAYLICGLGFLLLSGIGLQFKIDSYKTQIYGEPITVKVTEVPNIIFYNDVTYKFRFQYFANGAVNEFSKNYYPKYGVLVAGQDLKLKANLNKHIFLYEQEDVRTEFYAMAIMGLFGLFLMLLSVIAFFKQ